MIVSKYSAFYVEGVCGTFVAITSRRIDTTKANALGKEELIQTQLTKAVNMSAASIDRNTPYESLPQYLTVDEVRKWLAVSRTTAYEIAGTIGVRFGKLIRVPREALRPHATRETKRD